MVQGAPVDPNESRVLAALLRVDAPVTGRSVARVTGLSQSTTQRVLNRLRESGLVVAEPAPPSWLYRANRDHLAMPALRSLLHLDEELRTRAAEHVAAWRLAPASLVVYGSVARGEAVAGSDIDVLAVRAERIEPDELTWQHQLAGLADHLQRWTGRRGSVVEMSRSEAVQGLADREPFLVEAERDGWLIAGESLSDLAGHRS
ncbi:MAG TPA: MarR family transcriptional regulator [Candidatus Dormibacteraeota bacterium]|jgi:predicted nucleotidyltransferase